MPHHQHHCASVPRRRGRAGGGRGPKIMESHGHVRTRGGSQTPTTSPLAHLGVSLAGWPAGPHPDRQGEAFSGNPSTPHAETPRLTSRRLFPARTAVSAHICPHPIPRSHRSKRDPEPTQWRPSPSPPPSRPSPRTPSSSTRPSKVPLRPRPHSSLALSLHCTRRRLTRSAFSIDRRLGHQREADHLHPGPPQRGAAPRDPPRVRRGVREGAAPRPRRRDPRQVRGR